MTDRQKKGFLFNVIFIAVRAGDGRLVLVGPGARALVCRVVTRGPFYAFRTNCLKLITRLGK
jgi:hypothetical protein